MQSRQLHNAAGVRGTDRQYGEQHSGMTQSLCPHGSVDAGFVDLAIHDNLLTFTEAGRCVISSHRPRWGAFSAPAVEPSVALPW